MRTIALVGLCGLLGGCAFSGQMQRFGVEYNAALAEMSNEQTLVNILRARDGMPTHFIAVSLFRGSVNLTAGGSLNGQLRGSGLTNAAVTGFSNTVASTASTTTNVVSPGALPSTSTVASTVITPVTNGSVTNTIAEGVDLYTPQVSGQIVSGTQMDVAVFDTQKFYQGITTSVPFSTIETFINQGIDRELLARLMIAKIEFRLTEEYPGYPKGKAVLELVNDISDFDPQLHPFSKFLNCYAFGVGVVPKETTNLVAVNRLTQGADGKAVALAIDKVVVADGEKFTLTGKGITSKPEEDQSVSFARITPAKRVPRFAATRLESCYGDKLYPFKRLNGEVVNVGLPADLEKNAPPNAIYLDNSEVLLFVNKQQSVVPVDIEVTFRSTDGLFRYLDAYLRANANKPQVGGADLFSVRQSRERNALARAYYRGEHYSLINDLPDVRNAQIFTMLQQLINLQKEASERPNTIPVRAIS